MYRQAAVAVVLILFSVEARQHQMKLMKQMKQMKTANEENAIIEELNDCKSVPAYLCDSSNNIIRDGTGLIRPRRRRSAAVVDRIQCKGGNFWNEIVCCKYNNGSSGFKFGTNCGIQKHNPVVHNGGADLNPLDGEFPWIASIYKRTSSETMSFICSGSLIHPNVVLTSNQCVHTKDADDLKVVVNGETERSISNATSEEKRKVSEIISHPEYDSTLLHNNAALLILDKPFKISNWGRINTLCLPPDDFDLKGKKCVVVGWVDDNEGENSDLKKVEVPFVNRTQCAHLLEQTTLTRSFDFHSSFMCAGGEKTRDVCIEGGGAPLMCPMDEDGRQYFQAGIVSKGFGCGKKDVPAIYTDVRKINKWITNALSIRQLNA